MRVLSRYISREILITFAAVSAVLLVIVVGNVFAQLLSQVTQGRLPLEALMPTMGYTSLNFVVQLLPVAMFLAMVLSLGRMYQDNEMSAMSACGIGYAVIYRGLVTMIAVFMLIYAVMVMWIAPWANDENKKLAHEMSLRSDLAGLTPGRFTENKADRRVMFIESLSEDKREMRELFTHQRDPQRQNEQHVVTAKTAHQEFSGDQMTKFLVLEQGQYYQGNPQHSKYQLMQFDRMTLHLQQPPNRLYEGSRSALPMHELFSREGIKFKTEIQWRVSIVVSTLMLLLLAIPLSYTAPRKGRFAKVIYAIIIYIVYTNILALVKDKLDSGELPLWLGMWPVHFAVLAMMFVLIARQYGWPWVLKGWRQA